MAPMAGKDLYAILGVARDAGADEIKSAYRQLARELHPDVRPGDEAAEKRFKEVSAAYSVLSDAEKRGLYDEFGEVALQAGFDKEKAEQMRRFGGGGGFDFGGWSNEAFTGFAGSGGLEELLGSILGGRFGGRGGFRAGPGRPAKGADVRAEAWIDLPLAVQGGKTTLGLQGGRTVDVTVPPGVRDGQSLRLSGLGAPGPAGHGDLYVKLRIREHPSFRRDGDDLHVDVPVTVEEAVLGGKVSVPGPTGEVTITVPPRTPSGRSLRLRGLGVKGGNLYARIVVVLPEEGGERLEELARELGALYEGDVRAGLRF